MLEADALDVEEDQLFRVLEPELAKVFLADAADCVLATLLCPSSSPRVAEPELVVRQVVAMLDPPLGPL